jgi:superfamily I DNA/RNA helicase
VAVATAVLREDDARGGVIGEIAEPNSTRMDGPVPTVIAHADEAEEAAWVAQRAKMSRLPGRRWSSIAVMARTNAQLAGLQAALEAARVPCHVAGSDLGPASDLRHTGSAGHRFDADDDREEEVDTDKVVLTTFHRAKGLQWTTVVVVGLSADLMPIASARTPDAIDEERRLLYVALTRAEEELWCSWSEGRDASSPSASGRPRSPSPWLAPIVRTIGQLKKEAEPTSASEVSARVAELRRHLDSGAPGTGTH